MLTLATLGLLKREPLHGYRLKQQLEIFMSSCMSVNYGAIYPMLKRLESQGHIMAVTELPDSVKSLPEEYLGGLERKQHSKVYQITPAGDLCWHQMMTSHPQESWINSRARFMIKFCFLGDLPVLERIALMEHRLMQCRLRLQHLSAETTTALVRDTYLKQALERAFAMLISEMTWVETALQLERQGYTPV